MLGFDEDSGSDPGFVNDSDEDVEEIKRTEKSQRRKVAFALNEEDNCGLYGEENVADPPIEVDKWGGRFDVDPNVPIEPFNMQQERKEGWFDAQGHFIEDDGADDDAWWDEMKEALGKRERDEPEDRMKKRKLSSGNVLYIDESEVDLDALKALLVKDMKPNESVAAAIRRLGSADIPKEQFESFMETADMLMAAGEFDVYQMSVSDLEKKRME